MEIEKLFDLADELATEDNPRPDFPFPAGWNSNSTDELMKFRDGPKGRGWCAEKSISAGTVLLVAKPLAMVMNWEEDEGESDEDDAMEDEDSEGPTGAKRNGLLVLKLIQCIKENPALWQSELSDLFPRSEQAALLLPLWTCRDSSVGMDIERAMESLKDVSELTDVAVKQIRMRLPLIVRYNCLSVETSPELLIHPGPGGHASLSGTALYYKPSFFNHDHIPNVSRWAIGDVMFFVANRDIKRGDDVCISYIDHDILCECCERRLALLDMDFLDEDDENESVAGEAKLAKNSFPQQGDGPDAPVIDADVQSELMEMAPSERLEAIQNLLDQATGTSQADDDNESREEPASWFKCDAHNLRILLAITLDGLGRSEEAHEQWEMCVAFAEEELPPHDENAIVMRVQAALCARCLGRKEIASTHAGAALQAHCVLFGGDVARFRRRYKRELDLQLRPCCDAYKSGSGMAMDALWPTK